MFSARYRSAALVSPITGVLAAALLFAAGCETTSGSRSSGQPSGVARVSPDDRLGTRGMDRLEIDEAADELTRRMLDSGFLERGYTGRLPAIMVMSDIENLSDIPRFPKEVIAARVRERLLQSGKVQFVSFFGQDGTDPYATGIQDDLLEQFPELDTTSRPARGSLQAPRLSLRTQVQSVSGTDGRFRQTDYQVRMFVSDMATGLVVWEGVSEPVSKVEGVGW
ncbi:MAG: hypothetical protein AAF235_07765 [Planctomycetota bacterium]